MVGAIVNQVVHGFDRGGVVDEAAILLAGHETQQLRFSWMADATPLPSSAMRR
jgi:hypothetical protein